MKFQMTTCLSVLCMIGGFALGQIINAAQPAGTKFQCANTSSGDGSLVLTFSSSINKVGVIFVDASGVEDGSGTLLCTGPNESAYICTGKLEKLESNDFTSATLTIQESFFQTQPSTGTVTFNGESFACR